MNSASSKTFLVLAILGPIIGFLVVVIYLLPIPLSFEDVLALFVELGLAGSAYVFAICEVLAFFSAGIFVCIGRLRGHLPYWAALVPGAFGFIFALVVYWQNDFQAFKENHGPANLLIIGPAATIALLGLVSFLGVRRYWVSKSQ